MSAIPKGHFCQCGSQAGSEGPGALCIEPVYSPAWVTVVQALFSLYFLTLLEGYRRQRL